jgi:dienelactone hydrolase
MAATIGTGQRIVRLMLAALTVMLCLVDRPTASLAQSAQPTFGRTEEEVTFQSGAITLSGTLLKPATAGLHPAVVIVPSSSPNERGPYRDFATDVFAQHGVAALIYDKRGYGQSSGNPETTSLYDLAEDALAGVRYLQHRADIDPHRVGMEGDSQAGWVIPIAAARAKDIAFLVMVSASAVSQAQAEVFGIETRIRNAGLSERVADAGRKARRLSHITPEPADLDPVPFLEQLTQPVLIFLGEADSQLPSTYSALVFDTVFRQTGHQDYTIIIYPGANHGIQVPTTNAQGKTTMQYVDGYRATMATWVVAHVTGRATPGTGLHGHASDQSVAFIEGGIYGKTPWYGTAPVQLSLIYLFALVFVSASLGLTIRAVLRTVRQDRTVPAAAARRASLLALVSSALNLIVLAGVYAFIGVLSSSIEEVRIPPLFNALPVLSLLATLLTIGMGGFTVLAWKDHYWSPVGRVSYAMLALVAVLFVAFLNYWNLIGFQL